MDNINYLNCILRNELKHPKLSDRDIEMRKMNALEIVAYELCTLNIKNSLKGGSVINNVSIKKTGSTSLEDDWIKDEHDKCIQEELKILEELIRRLPLPIPEKYLAIYGGKVKYLKDYLEQNGFLKNGDGIKITEIEGSD